MKFNTLKQAWEYVGRLTKPSKMPCYSYNLPVAECRTGQKLMKVEGTVCSACYANSGLYKLYEKTVVPSQYKRLKAIAKPYWVHAMAFIIKFKKMDYMRFHDAGDLQSVSHFAKICEVARLCGFCKIWLPTRELSIVSTYVKNGGIIPKNLIVRLSAFKLDSPAPEGFAKKMGVQVSTVKREGYNCPAPKQNNECGSCRKCWDANVFEVSYKLH